MPDRICPLSGKACVKLCSWYIEDTKQCVMRDLLCEMVKYNDRSAIV